MVSSLEEPAMNPAWDRLLRILDEHGRELHALFTRLTLREDVAEDLLQNLCVRLLDADGFARTDNPRGYAFRTAINLAFDWRRRRRRERSTRPLPDELEGATVVPLSGLIRAEELEQTLDAVDDCLSLLQRQVVVLHYLQEQDYKEVAEQL